MPARMARSDGLIAGCSSVPDTTPDLVLVFGPAGVGRGMRTPPLKSFATGSWRLRPTLTLTPGPTLGGKSQRFLRPGLNLPGSQPSVGVPAVEQPEDYPSPRPRPDAGEPLE